jgi:hypothetical protein
MRASSRQQPVEVLAFLPTPVHRVGHEVEQVRLRHIVAVAVDRRSTAFDADCCNQDQAVAEWIAFLHVATLPEVGETSEFTTDEVWFNDFSELSASRGVGRATGPDQSSFDFLWERAEDSVDRIMTIGLPADRIPVAIWRCGEIQEAGWQSEEWIFDLPELLWPAGVERPRSLAAAGGSGNGAVVMAEASIGFVATPSLGPPRTIHFRLFVEERWARHYAAELRFEHKRDPRLAVDQPLPVQFGKFSVAPLPMEPETGLATARLGENVMTDELIWEVPGKLPPNTKCRLLIRPLRKAEQVRFAADTQLYHLTGNHENWYQVVRQPDDFGLSGKECKTKTGFLLTKAECAAQQAKMRWHLLELAEKLQDQMIDCDSAEVSRDAMENMEASIVRGLDTSYMDQQPSENAIAYHIGTYKKSKASWQRKHQLETTKPEFKATAKVVTKKGRPDAIELPAGFNLKAEAKEFFRLKRKKRDHVVAFMLRWFSKKQPTYLEIAKLLASFGNYTDDEIEKWAERLRHPVSDATKQFQAWLRRRGIGKQLDD